MDTEPRAARDVLLAVRELLEHPPRAGETWSDRAARVREMASELDAHGVDGLSLVRFGMGQLFAAPVLGSVAVSVFLELRGDHMGAVVLDEAFQLIDVAGWRAALGMEAAPRSPEDLGEMLGHSASMVESWIAWAPVNSLVQLAPVSKEQLAIWAAATDASTRAAADVYRWLVERSLEADLEQWSTPSLKLEYRYSVQGEDPKTPESFLATSIVEPTALAHALAARVLRDEAQHEQSEWVALLSAVQKQAKMLLCQGRCTEAAALFEFLIGRNPGDPALRNNLAFCLVTTQPEDATDHLRDAHRMGFGPKSLLLYNRACCATTEAIKREVLFDANRHWVSGLESVPVGAFIWRMDPEFMPTETFDVRVDLARAARDLARELGELERSQVWDGRLEEVERTGESPSTIEPGERR